MWFWVQNYNVAMEEGNCYGLKVKNKPQQTVTRQTEDKLKLIRSTFHLMPRLFF